MAEVSSNGSCDIRPEYEKIYHVNIAIYSQMDIEKFGPKNS